VAHLVQLHGGTVAAQSEGAGQGSEFTVRLPLSEAPPPAVTPKPALLTTEGRRVLIVDDNVGAARMLSLLVSNLGRHHVEVAHEGASALQIAEGFRPELVLLDIGMPGMNGYEVARALRKTPVGAEALIVAVTGYGQEEDRRRSREAGFDEHLVKPPSREHIEQVLNHPRLQRRGGAVAASPAPLTPRRAWASAPKPAGVRITPAPDASLVYRRTGDFLREVVHEVGNAVQPLQLMLQVLQHADLNPAMIDRLRQALESQLPPLERLLHDLRRVSSVARGMIQAELRSTDAAHVVRRAADRVQPRLKNDGKELRISLPESLPRLQADAGLLEEALVELLDNAARHTQAGDRIEMTADQRDDRLVIAVRDTGSGIPATLLPHLFDVFVRGDEGGDGAAGHYGIGLAFVRQVAVQHGGEVEARSNGPKQGSEFALRLPLTLTLESALDDGLKGPSK
jgi:signal transduction histidine kinase